MAKLQPVGVAALRWTPPLQNSAKIKELAALPEAEPLRPLQCPACFAEFDAPANWPETICPSCKRETLVPKP